MERETPSSTVSEVVLLSFTQFKTLLRYDQSQRKAVKVDTEEAGSKFSLEAYSPKTVAVISINKSGRRFFMNLSFMQISRQIFLYITHQSKMNQDRPLHSSSSVRSNNQNYVLWSFILCLCPVC